MSGFSSKWCRYDASEPKPFACSACGKWFQTAAGARLHHSNMTDAIHGGAVGCCGSDSSPSPGAAGATCPDCGAKMRLLVESEREQYAIPTKYTMVCDVCKEVV